LRLVPAIIRQRKARMRCANIADEAERSIDHDVVRLPANPKCAFSLASMSAPQREWRNWSSLASPHASLASAPSQQEPESATSFCVPAL
jgi:hypothetical protein